MEKCCVLESVGDITDIAIVSCNQSYILEKSKYLPIKNRASKTNFEFPGKTCKDKRKKYGKIKLHCKHSYFSKSTGGLFCAACVQFPIPAHGGPKVNSLITQLYCNWKDIKEDMKNHSALQYHKDSMEILRSFVKKSWKLWEAYF